MKDLNYQLKNLCSRNQDGSRATQAERFQLLQTMANHLSELGYRRMDVTSLKPKHVDALIAKYLNEDLASGTIKNRLSALRWWAEKIGCCTPIVARLNRTKKYRTLFPRHDITTTK